MRRCSFYTRNKIQYVRCWRPLTKTHARAKSTREATQRRARAVVVRWERDGFDDGTTKERGEAGLVNQKPGFKPGIHPKKISKEREDRILHLRTRYHFGPHRTVAYLARYHNISISMNGVYYVLKRQRKRSTTQREFAL